MKKSDPPADSIPVALIAFNRPIKTKAVIERIHSVEGLKLYFYVDGPRQFSDVKAVQEVRNLGKAIKANSLVSRFSEENLGLKRSVLAALDEVFSTETTCVILEDDCVPNRSFFEFVHGSEHLLLNNQEIAMISGNTFMHEPTRTEAYFSNQAHIWGWMTSKYVWKQFRASNLGACSGKIGVKNLVGLVRVPGPLYYRLRNLHLAMRAHKLDTWAVYFSCWIQLNRKLVLHPPQNLVKNIGFDESATHTARGAPDMDLESHDISLIHLPTELALDTTRMRRHSNYRVRKLTTFILLKIVRRITDPWKKLIEAKVKT